MRLWSLARHFTTPGHAALPDVVPFARPHAEVKPAECYEPDATVWAYIAGVWRRAHVIEGAEAWVVVRYCTPGTRDLAIEAVTPRCVMDL